jgi:hypothetical protein
VSSPFREALPGVRGKSWLEEAARASLRAAHGKFFGSPSEPLLKVELRSARQIGAYDTALVSMALQNATAKLAHVLRDPKKEWTQARRKDREEALLVPRGQAGGTLFFGFPSTAEDDEESFFPDHHVASLSETAARELCEILPGSPEDDAAIDAVLGQRTTIRSAVSDLVDAVTETACGLSLDLTTTGVQHVTSQLSTTQAEVLMDSLRETRTDRRTQTMIGRLDGVRTRRRIFYLELETGEEIQGAVGPDEALMAEIRRHLDGRVVATVESERVESMGGRRGRPTYRLIGLSRDRTLFDEE